MGGGMLLHEFRSTTLCRLDLPARPATGHCTDLRARLATLQHVRCLLHLTTQQRYAHLAPRRLACFSSGDCKSGGRVPYKFSVCCDFISDVFLSAAIELTDSVERVRDFIYVPWAIFYLLIEPHS